MKKSALVINFFLLAQVLMAQNSLVDSLHRELTKSTTDTGKIIILYSLSNAYQDSNPDSALLLAQQAYFLAKNKKFLKGESWALSQMGTAFTSMGNFPKALEYYLEQLKIEETRGRLDNIAGLYLNIAFVYSTSKDYEKAITYAKKADSIIIANKVEDLSLYSLLNIGDIYEKKNMLDSALAYTNRCYAKSIKAGNDLITGTSLNNLGNIYYKTGNLQESSKNFKAGLPYLERANDLITYAEGMLGLAKVFERDQQFDSAIAFGKKSFDIATRNQFLVKALDAGSFLAQLYKKQRNIDSAFVFQEFAISLKDSIDSREKIKEVQNLTTQEQVRQNEIALLKKKESKERSQQLQLLLIGIFIPIFFFISIVISRKKVNKKLIEFSGIFSVLLFFEYITLMLHPYIAEKSHHSPLIEIVIFVAIAAFITPSHHKIEHWLIAKLTQYNYLRHYKAPVAEPEENANKEDLIVEGDNIEAEKNFDQEEKINEEEIKN